MGKTKIKMSERNLHRLSNDMSVEFDGETLTLYAHTPKRITIIMASEMEKLMALYKDGCCPVCLEEIALNDVICDDCFEQAKQARR